MPADITLAGHQITVVGQRHAYLLHEIPKFLAKLPGAATDLIDVIDGDVEKAAESLPAFLGEHAYEALAILIPRLKDTIPEHEFRGFATREAMHAGDYDPEYDRSPSFDEIVAAFEAVIAVNRFDTLKGLKGVFSGEGGADPTRALSMISASSPPTNGASPRTSSGTTPRT